MTVQYINMHVRNIYTPTNDSEAGQTRTIHELVFEIYLYIQYTVGLKYDTPR